MISKIVFQSIITSVLKHMMNELQKTQQTIFWGNYSPKIKHETLCNDYKPGGLKNIPNKTRGLQCSWIRRIYDNSFYEWKLILLYIIKISCSTSFKFYSNLPFKSNKTKFFSSFYRGNCFELEKNVLLWSLKHLLVFCHNICGIMIVSK